MQELLMKECPPAADAFLYQTYLSMILGVFLCACRDLCELRYIASQVTRFSFVTHFRLVWQRV